jgi:hypothetical protein
MANVKAVPISKAAPAKVKAKSKREVSPLEQFEQDCSGKGYNELATILMELQQRKDEIKKMESMVTAQIDAITIRVIPDKMAEDRFRSVNLVNGGSIRLSKQAYCSTREGQKQALFEWLQEHEFPELITEVVNPSTLKAFIHEQLEAGNPVPGEDIINWQPYTRASIVGVKNR